MKIYKLLVILLVFSCFLIYSDFVKAHDLWLNVDNHYPQMGEKVNVKVVFGHNFPYYDILIPKEVLSDFSYVTPEGKKKVISQIWEDKRGERKGALVGEIAFCGCRDQKGTYVVAASRKVKGDKTHVPSEKYGKTIIILGNKNTESVSYVFGHRIEIVPLKSPSEVKVGKALPVKILFEGKPLSTYVYATYAGYWSEDEPFPIVVKSDEKGVAYIKISGPGIWMVVCNHKVDFSASLTFEIK